MKKAQFTLMVALLLTICTSLFAADRDIAPMRERKPGQPALAARQGWLTISNRDWIDYYITMDSDNARLLLDKRNNGGARIASGHYLVVPLERAMWEVVGDSARDLVEVRIRPGQEAELALVPSGSVDNSGLVGVVMADGQRSTGILYGVDGYNAAVIPERNQIPASNRVRFDQPEDRYSLPSFGRDRIGNDADARDYADPRGGSGAGIFPQTRAAIGNENFHDELFNRSGSGRRAPDVMGDVLKDMGQSTVDGITGGR